jgi:phage shock protein PspC (stress-responsive transcriptional regulator)
MSTIENDAPTSPPPAPPPPRRKRLQRSRRDRVLAGVAGGLGEYFDVDPVIFRIAFGVLVFVGGAGLLLYPAAWLLLPEEGHKRSIAEGWIRTGQHGKWVPIALIVIGGLVLLGQFDDHDGGLGFAIAAIVIGVLLLRRHTAPPQPAEPWAMTPQPQSPDATTEALAPTDAPPADVPAADTPPTDPSSWTPPPPGFPPPAPPTGGGGSWGPTTEELLPPPPPPTGRSLTTLVLSVLLIAGGVVGLLHAADVVSVNVPLFLAGALIFVGIALLASAWYGGTPGLVAIAIVLTVGLGVAAVFDAPLRGGVGDRRWVPSSADELRSNYRLGAGQLTIDLSHITLPPEGRVVRASVGGGELRIFLPAQGYVVVDAHAGIGDLRILGRQNDGWDVDQHVRDGDPSYGSLRLDVEVGAGEITVLRELSVPGPRPIPPRPELPEAPVPPLAPPTSAPLAAPPANLEVLDGAA